ncbi:MAG: LysR family transcriptional regulator [Atopobiaceae bacterium]
MEIRTLRYFLAVAREENMTEAANVLHVTQPTLSRQIAELEAELGCTLFVRTNRATTLTEDGMRLRQRAEEILALVEQTESEVGPGAELQGTVRIGAAETRAMTSVVEAFRRVRTLHPKVQIELSTGNADAIEERLERGVVDFAVVLEPFKVEKYDHLKLPLEERVGLIVPPGHPLAQKAGIHPEDFEGLDLMVSSRTAHESFDLDAWSGGALHEGSYNIVGRHDMIGNALLLVRGGLALALSIEGVCPDDLAFVPLEPALTAGAYLIWKKFRLLSKPGEAFLDEMRRVADKS